MPPGTEEPQLEDVLAAWLRAGMAKLHTAIPATVVVYDPTVQRATVQPSLRARVDDVLLDTERPDIALPPPISNVPVVWPSGGTNTWSIHGPLNPGDPVLLVIAERSTDEWRSVGAPDTTPLDARRFDLSDAFAIPGGRHFNPTVINTGPLPAAATDPGAVVVRGLLVKLGAGPTAVHQLLHGETFESDLAAWLSALSTLIAAMAVVSPPAVWVPAVQAAAATFATAHSAFVATVSSGIHRSVKVFTE